MGPSPRGGAYTYDWIENLLGLDMHSADRVLPEYQHPRVGDTLGYESRDHSLAARVLAKPCSNTCSNRGTYPLTEHLRDS